MPYGFSKFRTYGQAKGRYRQGYRKGRQNGTSQNRFSSGNNNRRFGGSKVFRVAATGFQSMYRNNVSNYGRGQRNYRESAVQRTLDIATDLKGKFEPLTLGSTTVRITPLSLVEPFRRVLSRDVAKVSIPTVRERLVVELTEDTTVHHRRMIFRAPYEMGHPVMNVSDSEGPDYRRPACAEYEPNTKVAEMVKVVFQGASAYDIVLGGVRTSVVTVLSDEKKTYSGKENGSVRQYVYRNYPKSTIRYSPGEKFTNATLAGTRGHLYICDVYHVGPFSGSDKDPSVKPEPRMSSGYVGTVDSTLTVTFSG